MWGGGQQAWWTEGENPAGWIITTQFNCLLWAAWPSTGTFAGYALIKVSTGKKWTVVCRPAFSQKRATLFPILRCSHLENWSCAAYEIWNIFNKTFPDRFLDNLFLFSWHHCAKIPNNSSSKRSGKMWLLHIIFALFLGCRKSQPWWETSANHWAFRWSGQIM